jgi:hypothetical protein
LTLWERGKNEKRDIFVFRSFVMMTITWLYAGLEMSEGKPKARGRGGVCVWLAVGPVKV